MSFVKTKAFPTLIYEIDCSDLVEPVRELHNKVRYVGQNSFVSDNFYVLTEDIKSNFEKKVNTVLDEIEYQVPFRMTTSWFTRTEPNKKMHRHKHTNSYWSASFYFYDNCAPLCLNKEKPQIYVPYSTKDPELMMSGTVVIGATLGKLILFPSGIEHYVSENTSGFDRYSLAMNFMPTGFCNYYDSSYQYN